MLQDSGALKECIDKMKYEMENFGEFDVIVGPESRGFIFGTPLAYLTGKGVCTNKKRRVNFLIQPYLWNTSWNMVLIF